jgi:hypothetical protein
MGWTGRREARFGLSVMSWHARLAEIGRTRRKPDSNPAENSRPAAAAGPAPNDFYDDQIPF